MNNSLIWIWFALKLLSIIGKSNIWCSLITACFRPAKESKTAPRWCIKEDIRMLIPKRKKSLWFLEGIIIWNSVWSSISCPKFEIKYLRLPNPVWNTISYYSGLSNISAVTGTMRFSDGINFGLRLNARLRNLLWIWRWNCYRGVSLQSSSFLKVESLVSFSSWGTSVQFCRGCSELWEDSVSIVKDVKFCVGIPKVL